jgi:hypothetical protein
MRRAQGDATAYSTTARYAIGARVSHKTFGEGVVARLASSTVCEVVFLERTVKLVMGALLAGGADAVLAASIFHYGEFSVREAKAFMTSAGLAMRLDV